MGVSDHYQEQSVNIRGNTEVNTEWWQLKKKKDPKKKYIYIYYDDIIWPVRTFPASALWKVHYDHIEDQSSVWCHKNDWLQH